MTGEGWLYPAREWDNAEVARFLRNARERERKALDRLARTILCCAWCGCALKLKGYIAPGGISVTLATCPQCDTYREGDDA